MEKNIFAAKTDEELVELAHQGNHDAQDYLIDKYRNLVKLKTRMYFMIGADKEDIIQEGMIGLFKAIRDYNPVKSVSFYSFAKLCMTRQIITAVKAATRQKHIPMNSYVSLSQYIHEDGPEKTYLDILPETRTQSPEELFIGRETKLSIETHMGQVLSELECQTLSLYLQGKSYLEIAQLISKDEKAIDNALQRVRRKLEKFLGGRYYEVINYSKTGARH